MTPEAPETPRPVAGAGLRAAAGVVIAALFVYYFRIAIGLIVHIAATDPNWSHVFLIPFISLWFIWRDRDLLRRTPARPSWWGLPLLLSGMLAYQGGLFLQSSMAIGWPMIISLLGLSLLLGGKARTKILLLPILYLLFAVKITVLWEPIAERLQRLAAELAALVLNVIGVFLGIEADAEGAIIRMFHRGIELKPPLDVDEACSGLRMMMALLALSVAWAFAGPKTRRQRVAIVAAALPTAVLVNVLRITLTGLVFPWRPEWTRGLSHDVLGFLMVVPALWLLTRVEVLAERLGRAPADSAEAEPGADQEHKPRGGSAPQEAPSSPPGPLPAAWCAAAVVLAAGILGADTVTRWTHVALAKAPAPLRQPLAALPRDLGPYRLAAEQTLSERALKVLGTHRYVSRVYRDTRRAPDEPGAGIWVHAAYYTGSSETLWIRHTPEQCYIGQGHRPLGTSDGVLETRGAVSPRQIPVRMFAFVPHNKEKPVYAVYFFLANGKFVASRRGIRLQALDIRRRTSWYCKIELLPGRFTAAREGSFEIGMGGRESTLAACADFLQYLLPALEECLPETPSVQGGVKSVR